MGESTLLPGSLKNVRQMADTVSDTKQKWDSLSDIYMHNISRLPGGLLKNVVKHTLFIHF